MAVVIGDLRVNTEIGQAKIFFPPEIKQKYEECMVIAVTLLFVDCVKV